MRRILLLLTASLVMAAMLAVGAGPAMAAKPGGLLRCHKLRRAEVSFGLTSSTCLKETRRRT
jgi:hypothetical protein